MSTSSPVTVVVTGAGGLVGRAVVERLLADGVEVVATDLDSPANRAWAAGLATRDGFSVDWCDLTDAQATQHLLWTAQPTAVVHLAAIIPPLCYRNPRLARRVNVEATAHLLAAATSLTSRPRFVQASSVAVHGPRNPYRDDDLLTDQTPVAATDVYGAQKAEAEALVRACDLEWTILRLGGVMTAEVSGGMDHDLMDFSAMLPADGRIQTVEVRDVARAFSAAARRPAQAVAGRTFLIGGDESHRIRQGDLGTAMTAASGLDGGLPPLAPGVPERDETWFSTDWMDTAPAQDALDFQRITWPALLAEIRATTGRKRYLMRLVAPVVHELVRRRPVRRSIAARGHADVWADVAERFGHATED